MTTATYKGSLLALLLSLSFPAIGGGGGASPSHPGPANNPQVLIRTSVGEFMIELYPEKAPQTVSNFMAYVQSNFYNGTIFHRVIDGFMIQGGGYSADFYKNTFSSEKKTRPPIQLEAKNGLKNSIGWVAMARTNDPNSATSQFFINTANNPDLDHRIPDRAGYAVFGKVISGMETVNTIGKTTTKVLNGTPDVPTTPITIESIALVKEGRMVSPSIENKN